MHITPGQLKNAVDRVLEKVSEVAATAAKAVGEVAQNKADRAVMIPLVIPAEGWQQDDLTGCPYYLDIAIEGLTADDCVAVVVAPDSADVAGKAGFACTESRAGVLRLRARTAPTAAVNAIYYIVK